MGLQAVYERFLSTPNAAVLADNATLQYVTTLKSFSQKNAIVVHLDDQAKNIVRKKSEKVISAVEGLTSVVVIVETVLEFVSSGGTYLPGVDEFILDRVATLPITHFVHFDQDDKITQICLNWDQGDLLKQVEVIGARGRNWPVFAGKDQVKMITTSTNDHNRINPAPALSPRGRNRTGVERSASPTKRHIRDPHASLNVFHNEEEERQPSVPNAVAPRESHKPPPREMSDLFAAGHEDYAPGPGASPKKIGKDTVVAPKGAGHKKFQPSRIFEEDELPKKERQIYKTNPARYNHFDIGDSFDDAFQHNGGKKQEEMPIRSQKAHMGRGGSQWDFEDFTTPEKVKQKVRDNDVVHFSYGNDENVPNNEAQRPVVKARKDQESHFEMQDDGTPVTRPVVHKPRPDATSNFNFTDEQTPAPRRIIARTAAASKIYSDPVFGDEEPEKPLASLSSNAPAKARVNKARSQFESSWQLGD